MQLSLDLPGALPFKAGARTRPRVHLVPPPAAPIAPALPPIAPSTPAAPLSLREKIARLERGAAPAWGVVSLGDARLDGRLPGGGLPLGHWHEIIGEAREREWSAASAGFAATLAQCAMGAGVMVWVAQRDDVHAPGLQAFGLDPDRVIFVRVDKDKDVLAVQEDALRTRGISACVGEVSTLDLTAGRRLQLACERSGATALVLRRSLFAEPRVRQGRADAAAATTRWRVSAAPGEHAFSWLGAPRWSVALDRCRGGRTGGWLMEANTETEHGGDAQKGALRVVAELADHAAETRFGNELHARPARLRADGGERERAASHRG